MASAAVDLMNMLENSAYNKTNMVHFKQTLLMCEKMKVPYHASLMAVPQDDKKANKKPKKITSSNKYILFNTFISKIKQPGWPNSYNLWNVTKSDAQNANFLKIFNYIETITKRIIVKKPVDASHDQANALKKSGKKNEYDTEEIEESNQKRSQYYNEFIEVLKKTYFTGQAPNSFIFDENLNKPTLEKAMNDFKLFLSANNNNVLSANNSNITAVSVSAHPPYQPQHPDLYAPEPTKAGSKRAGSDRSSESSAKKARKDSKRSTGGAIKKTILMASPSHYQNMSSDTVYDSNMSD